MTMAQRTSSAKELNQRPPVSEGFGTPVLKFEFEPAAGPEAGLVYLNNRSVTEHGTWVIIDGFYVSSHGDRPAVAVLLPSNMVDGTFSEDKKVPSVITRAAVGVYFLSRDMAEYCVKKMLESNSTIEHAVSICPGKTYNNLVDQLEDRDQVGHYEDGQVMAVNVEQPDGDEALPVMIGLTEILVNKKLRLVHVVAKLEKSAKSLELPRRHDLNALTDARYYSIESVARMGYREVSRGRKPLESLSGVAYDGIVQHLIRNSK